jgi:hypothetical protein
MMHNPVSEICSKNLSLDRLGYNKSDASSRSVGTIDNFINQSEQVLLKVLLELKCVYGISLVATAIEIGLKDLFGKCLPVDISEK